MNALPKTDPALNSCDEYPFASTVEGGASASIAWVPLAEQVRVDGDDIDVAQGTLLSTFYRENRVIEGDKFFVQP
ncbi:NucA/NucB deoxyribonuclease domain-containing protein [Williamsia sp. CHRR-6]|uniref:NucA/NucB deoxyribonuclease domain-containing protein n=1 Tax=Williamsia sp. CHRR-6 TaxID=2835871 RepID=UPI001BD9E394|nr:NucA/NucB deoxyribonuclease domain-containing protein [Williamsia sp. CHRR-6]MBT0565650.1 hypothetical protein [Williamsia sp. CHRR-6]